MINSLARQISMAALALTLLSAPAVAQAQQGQPSAAAIALAKEILVLKGAASLYEVIIPDTVERARGVLIQSNPMLRRQLDEVTAKMKTDFQVRNAEMMDIVHRAYASRFTEAELKELIAFYKSPVGQKVNQEEPKILEQSVSVVNDWAARLGEEILVKMRQEMRRRGHEM